MSKDGFSIMTVMIGSVVVAALGIVYMQKARNKAQIATIADIIAYRDYAFRYYSEVAANRMAWPCTLKANPSLQNYVQGASTTTGPQNLWLYDVSGTGCVLAGTGEEVITGSGAGTAQGLGVKLHTDLPASVETYDPDNANHHLRIYSTWEGLGKNSVRIRLAAYYNNEHDDALTSFKIKEKEKFIYMGRTPMRNCGESLVGFHDDRGTGSRAPQRYFGDTAVVAADAKTRLVKCWEQGPLVIPPCFDLLEKGNMPIGFSNNCPSLSTNKINNYAGMCPEIHSNFVSALAGFDLNTGKTLCERRYGLILGDRVSANTAYKGVCADDASAFVGLRHAPAHKPLCSPADRFGTRGGRFSEGIAGWTTTGPIGAGPNVGNQGKTGKQGHPGVLPALKGDQGDSRDCSCTCSDGCTSDSDCSTGETCSTDHAISLCPSNKRCGSP